MIRRGFTLIEVVIATVTLALSATIAVEMTASAHMRTYNAESEWAREHLLTLGCEFYLLFGHEAEFPSDKLPEDYSIACELNEAVIPDEEEDEEKYDPYRGWVLGEYTITLFYQGRPISSISIDKFVPADMFE